MPQPDFVEVEAETYWNALKETLNNILNRSKVNAEDISGISVSSQGENLIVVDKGGKTLRKAIVWLDNRSKKEASIIKEEFGVDNVYRITGQNDVIPTWPTTKILWLKKNEALIFQRAYKYLLLEDYIIYKLTGKFVTEYSIVSSSLRRIPPKMVE
jgi:xylulokinase